MIFDKDDIWDDSDESLEDILYWGDELNGEAYPFETGNGLYFETGDIVMTIEDRGGDTVRRLLVVDRVPGPEDAGYVCFEISSDVSRANINNRSFPRSIFIRNYGSAVKRGSAPARDAYIDLGRPVVLDEDLLCDKPKKGEISAAFRQFITDELLKIKNNGDTSKDFWNGGRPGSGAGSAGSRSFRDADYLFSGLLSNAVEVKTLTGRPCREDGVLIEGKLLCDMGGGLSVELCLWSCDGMTFWDVSADKDGFDAKGGPSFTGYLASKGLPLENVSDRYGRWVYCGVIENSEQHRVQYYEEEDPSDHR